MEKNKIHGTDIGSIQGGSIWDTDWSCLVAEINLFFLESKIFGYLSLRPVPM